MATDHSGGDGKENRNITMNVAVFCGASLPHSEQITEAARQLGFGRVPEYSTADEEYTYRLFRKNITQ